MTDPTPSTSAADPWLLRFRERVTAIIAITVVVSTIILITAAIWYAASEQTYARVKDLLLFVNPLVGYVIGYYFTKTSTEARAEKAEATAQTAAVNTQQALQAQNQAQTVAEQAKNQAQEAVATLSEVTSATEQYVAQTQTVRRPGTLSDAGDTVPPAEDASAAVQAALARARRVLGR